MTQPNKRTGAVTEIVLIVVLMAAIILTALVGIIALPDGLPDRFDTIHKNTAPHFDRVIEKGVLASGSLTIEGDAMILGDLNTEGSLRVMGDIKKAHYDISIPSDAVISDRIYTTGSVTLPGNTLIKGNVDTGEIMNKGSGSITIYGDLLIEGDITTGCGVVCSNPDGEWRS